MSDVMSVYCRAYQLKQLRAFPGWREAAGTLSGETVVFVHDDFSVTDDVVRRNVLFAGDDAGWRTFCQEQLEFAIPADVTRAVEFAAGSGGAAS